ncbi:MAG TPA: LytTR family DNA-binding domain-containing protein [Cytophagaceae bacterium]|jgi:DNA-binding LytR/AlgR family response regulator|nr:LytTR family DNA-binding domain-containing protein [Cytophagaceae bacterium]
MNVLIVEDEIPAAQRLSKMMLTADPGINILAVVESIEQSIGWLKKNPAPDLIMMDIHLADGSSFEIFHQVQITCPVIFTTAYNEYALKAFEVNSIDYLLKPIKTEHLDRALGKFKKFKGTSQEGSLQDLIRMLHPATAYKTRFLVHFSDKLISVEEQEVAYFHSEEKIVFLVTGEGKRYVIDSTLEELEKVVNPKEFFRLNRQFIARLNSITDIFNHFNGKLKIKLAPAVTEEIYVSRERAPRFRSWLDGE